MIALEIEIQPELCLKAITYPNPRRETPGTGSLAQLYALALMLFPASLALLTSAYFDLQALPAVLLGGGVGAIGVRALRWRQHRILVGHHDRYNRYAGRRPMRFDETGIVAARTGIVSWIVGFFVPFIRTIPEATLIDIQNARLNAPDQVVDGPAGAYREQLTAWWVS